MIQTLILLLLNLPLRVLNFISQCFIFRPDKHHLPQSQSSTTVRKVEQGVSRAMTWTEWRCLNAQLDRIEGREEWRMKESSNEYDYKLIKNRLSNILALSEAEGVSSMMFLLRAGLIRNLGGIGKGELYGHCLVGTKELIETYIQEVVLQIHRIAHSTDPEITTSMKVDYFKDVLQGFGRTALVFHGGGASFGLCHLGVAKALSEADRLPRTICGSHIGALIAGLVCSMDEAELERVFAGEIELGPFDSAGSWQRKILRFLKHGKLFDIHIIEKCARDNIGDITFKEAFSKTGRILNIMVHTKRRHDVPVLLNYLTAPDVVVWSAASASCAVPGIYAAATLLVKDSKGAIVPWNPSAVRLSAAKVGDEIPVSRLSELFNVNNFIVSHVPSYFSWKFAANGDSATRAWLSRLWNWFCKELRHRLYQLKQIGLIPSSLQRLGDMVSTPGVGDVRIEPAIWTSDILHILANPSPRFVAYCLRKGQQAAWRHLSQINVRCAIEFEIERAIQQVRSFGKKSRLPMYK